ncbi:MAG: PPC domain-containing protein [Hyphomonadaceae bacterium]
MRKSLLAGAAIIAGFTALGAPAAWAQADPGGDAASAGRISAGRAVNASIETAGDVDWYRIRLSAGRAYTITLNGAGEAGLSDPFLAVFGADGAAGGEPLAFNDDSDGTLNSALSFTPPETGTYFIEARGFSEDATGAYALLIERGEVIRPPQASARIEMGGEVSAALDAAGEKDLYAVRLEAGQTYRIALNSTGETALSDPYLNLYAPRSVTPDASNDDGGGGLNSYLEYTAGVTGDHIIEARGFSDDATGGYALSVRQGDVPATIETDVTLSAEGDSRGDRLRPAGDTDWFRVELAEGAQIRVQLLSGGEAETPLDDPYLILRDSAGAELARDDDGGEGLNSYLEFTAPAAGAYFIEARGFGDEAEGGYTLNLLPGDIPDTAAGDEVLATSEGRVSRISPAGDADWFAVNMYEGRTYRFNLQGGEAEGELLDPLLTLMDPEGAAAGSDDDGGTGLNSYLTFTAPVTGTYYAAVSSFGGDGQGSYMLSVLDTEIPRDLGTDETLLGEDDARASRIDFVGDKDAFRIIVAAGTEYQLRVASAEEAGVANPALTLLNAEGEEIAANDDESRRSRNAALTFTAPAESEIVYAIVSGVNNATGGYDLTVSRTGAEEE